MHKDICASQITPYDLDVSSSDILFHLTMERKREKQLLRYQPKFSS